MIIFLIILGIRFLVYRVILGLMISLEQEVTMHKIFYFLTFWVFIPYSLVIFGIALLVARNTKKSFPAWHNINWSSLGNPEILEALEYYL